MKRGDKSFERELKRAVRAEIHRDRGLREEFKRQKRARRSIDRPAVRASLLMFVLPLALAAFTYLNSREWQSAAIVLALYATGTAFSRSLSFLIRLHASHELLTALHLPISTRAFFKWAWTRTVLLAWVVPASFCVAYVSFALRANRGVAVAAAFALALLQWALVSALIFAFAFLLRGRFCRTLAWSFYLVALVMFQGSTQLRAVLSQIKSILPAHWISEAFQAILGGRWDGTLAVLPAVVIAASGFYWLQAIQKTFALENLELIPANTTPQDEDEEFGPAIDAQMRAVRDEFRAGNAEQRAAEAWTNYFPVGLGNGPVERVVTAWLDAREREVASFLLAGQQASWSKLFKIASMIALAVLTVSPLVHASAPAFEWVAYPGILIATSVALPLLGGTWRGYNAGFSSMHQSPMYGTFPISFWELTRVALKVNAVRTVFFLPLWFAFSAEAGALFDQGAAYGLTVGIKVYWIFLCTLSFSAANKHLVYSSDIRDINRHTLLMVLGFFVVAAPLYIAAAIMLFLWNAWLSGLALLVLSILYWLTMGWLHERGRLDLIKLPDKGLTFDA